MALTRKFLTALGIEAEKIDEIITAHSETVDALKTTIEQYRADAEKLPAVQKELDEAKAAAEQSGKDPYKVKYEAVKEEFEAYKTEQSAKETKAAKESAYRALLKQAGVADKRIDAVLKVTELDGIELDKDGAIKGADKHLESIKAEWADFIPTTTTQGAQTANPPANNGGSLRTMDDIYKTDENGRFVYDATQRQKARAEMIAAQQQKG